MNSRIAVLKYRLKKGNYFSTLASILDLLSSEQKKQNKQTNFKKHKLRPKFFAGEL